MITPPFPWLVRVAIIHALVVADLRAVTMLDLENDRAMTPRRFAANFESFEYELNPEIQPPDVFLERQLGDCDDYTVLADYILRRKFKTRMIHIRLVGRIAHAVCYVNQSKAYLDYNNRKFFMTLQRSGGSLREIATEVAKSFDGNWTSASEFTYRYSEDVKRFTVTVVKTEPPSQDPDFGRYQRNRE